MSVVSLQGVAKEFGGGGVVAVQGIDLEIGEREFVSLIGPSGCGKSTLLRIIGDLIQPSSGEVTVKGKTAHRARSGVTTGSSSRTPSSSTGGPSPRTSRCRSR